MAMKWVITGVGTDPAFADMKGYIGFGRLPSVLDSGKAPLVMTDAVRLGVPRDAVEPFLKGYAERWSEDFRLIDCDGNVHFTGRCDQLDEQDGDSAFEPMDRFEGVTGVTGMQYRKTGETEWRDL